jgi:hypothetical protein
LYVHQIFGAHTIVYCILDVLYNKNISKKEKYIHQKL